MTRSTVKGWLGEQFVRFELWLGLRRDAYRVFYDLMVPAPDGGSTQVDHIVVSRFGIFVIETKNYDGAVYCNGFQDWVLLAGRRRYIIGSPVRQNYRHTRSLSGFLRLPHEVFLPVVYFVSGPRLAGPDIPAGVLNRRVAKYIRGFNTHMLSVSQLAAVCASLRDLKRWPCVSHAQHVRALERRHSRDTNMGRV